MALVTRFGVEELERLQGLPVAVEPALSRECWSPMFRPDHYCGRTGCPDPLLVYVDERWAWYRHGESLVRIELTAFGHVTEADSIELTHWLDSLHAHEMAVR